MCTSALIVQLHDDRGVRTLIVDKLRLYARVAVSCGYGTCFAVRTCDGLYHFIFSIDCVGIPTQKSTRSTLALKPSVTSPYYPWLTVTTRSHLCNVHNFTSFQSGQLHHNRVSNRIRIPTNAACISRCANRSLASGSK